MALALGDVLGDVAVVGLTAGVTVAPAGGASCTVAALDPVSGSGEASWFGPDMSGPPVRRGAGRERPCGSDAKDGVFPRPADAVKSP
ncbi:hypothetical protein Slu03_08260 [Sediminihabitans luteus]|nr:hypothetical protein Slu03_08260 [Sediminihabitans luteus]